MVVPVYTNKCSICKTVGSTGSLLKVELSKISRAQFRRESKCGHKNVIFEFSLFSIHPGLMQKKSYLSLTFSNLSLTFTNLSLTFTNFTLV